MALQWMILACVVAAEAAVAALLTLPAPRAVRAQIVGLTSLILQPVACVLPFAAFQLLGSCPAAANSQRELLPPRFQPLIMTGSRFLLLLLCADIYWKQEHRLTCTTEVCTAEERVRFEKSVSESRPYMLCTLFRFVSAFLGFPAA
jgi:hypothetical protein